MSKYFAIQLVNLNNVDRKNPLVKYAAVFEMLNDLVNFSLDKSKISIIFYNQRYYCILSDNENLKTELEEQAYNTIKCDLENFNIQHGRIIDAIYFKSIAEFTVHIASQTVWNLE
jgi:S-adenosylmethionine:diacylglycerol 3-amino-3-carboxypropyl transferase